MTDEEQDEQFYRDTESIAFPKLNDHQLSLLEPLAERRVMKRGERAFQSRAARSRISNCFARRNRSLRDARWHRI